MKDHGYSEHYFQHTSRIKPDVTESARLLSDVRRFQKESNYSAEPTILAQAARRAAYVYEHVDSDIHVNEAHNLLVLSDVMADHPEGIYDTLAAEARLEYLLKNVDDRWYDHLDTAIDLAAYGAGSAHDAFAYKQAQLLRMTAPLFCLLRQPVLDTMSINDVGQILQEVKSDLKEFVQLLAKTVYSSHSVEERETWVGYGSEAAVLAALLDPRLFSRGIIALPAFSFEDDVRKYCNSFDGSTRLKDGFDIGLYAIGASLPFKKLQVKAREGQTEYGGEPQGYSDDIDIIYTKTVTKAALAKQGIGGSDNLVMRSLGYKFDNLLPAVCAEIMEQLKLHLPKAS